MKRKFRICGYLATLIVSISIAVASGIAATSSQGPSFSCAGLRSETEIAICADSELSAYDRAMAWAWTHRWKSRAAEWNDQQAWLARRNACGARQSCIFTAYQEWVAGRSVNDAIGLTFERIEKSAIYHGGMLWRGDRGSLSIVSLGDGWILFRASAYHVYDPRDGRGPNMSDSGAVGVMRLSNGTGTWALDTCRVQLNQLSASRWRIFEVDRGCGGIGSTLAGDYRKR